MPIPTEPIGSIPRPVELIEANRAHATGELSNAELRRLQDEALRDTIRRFEETGSPVITDGEQTKPSFISYPLAGLDNLAPGGVLIPFADGHTRQLPRLTSGPFRYSTHADTYLREAKRHATRPVKQAVIAASAISLIYPENGIEGYSRDQFLQDLVNEAQDDIRGALDAGAHNAQMDFTEGRLSVKLDPSKGLLRSFVDLNNRVLEGFSDEERARIGVHTCPGGDQDSTHSADVDYTELLPDLFRLNVGNVYVQLASEKDRPRVLQVIKESVRPGQRVFVGVIDPIDPRIETPEEVRDRALEAAEFLSPEQMGTGDDCGFSPFGDDTSTSRDTAFEKVRARVEGTQMAAEKLGL
ncbi:MAG TPA: cobalamin-independent methionine synthase II family protein [Actinomycetota bacterium]|nr:cobalamin-independent methionine synthase II family protein [Actinomycetota bacterium]